MVISDVISLLYSCIQLTFLHHTFNWTAIYLKYSRLPSMKVTDPMLTVCRMTLLFCDRNFVFLVGCVLGLVTARCFELPMIVCICYF